MLVSHLVFFFFFNDTATTEIYTLSLHDALPIYLRADLHDRPEGRLVPGDELERSEEHTSELQSLAYLVCRLLLEKKQRNTGLSRAAAGQATADHVPDWTALV